jgi:hypothetical protein
MKTEYRKSLETWVRGLTDSQLGAYIESLDRFNDDEIDTLITEDVRRMQTA